MPKRIILYCFALYIISPNYALANNDVLYDIEILIFKRQNVDKREIYQNIPPDLNLKQTVELKPYFDGSTTLTYTDSKSKYKDLTYSKVLLNRTNEYKTIFHKRWSQPLSGTANFKVLLKSDEPLKKELNTNYLTNNYLQYKKPLPQVKLIYLELFKLYQGIQLGPTQPRYSFFKHLIHINTMHQILRLPNNPHIKNKLKEQHLAFYANFYAPQELIGTFKANANKYLEATLELRLSNLDKELPNVQYYKLKESARITANEIHYFDHPAFGALLKISKQAELE